MNKEKEKEVEKLKFLLKDVEQKIKIYNNASMIEMREMTYQLEQYMGKSEDVSTMDYLNKIKGKILWNLTRLTCSKGPF